MDSDAPLSARQLPRRTDDAHPCVMSLRELRRHGVSPATASARCRPGGPWQMPLPGVFLLHQGPPTGSELLQAVLRYAEGRQDGFGRTVVTGPAALALHGFACAQPIGALNQVDVLVPRTRRLRSTGAARIVRTPRLPVPVDIDGVPVAPACRAVTDTVAQLTDTATVRRLLAEAVRGGHCEPPTLVRELSRAQLLGRPAVAAALDSLIAAGRAADEERLMELVRDARLPDPCWNVELRLPDGSLLGPVDACWPEYALALAVGTGRAGPAATGGHAPGDPDAFARQGVTLLLVNPHELRTRPGLQAAVVRTALLAAVPGDLPGRITVLPR
ncbi:hypothetical protein [Streptomyces sodiiphilus]